MINFEFYKNFYFVAKNNSISKAATELQVTQSAISQSIKQLEIYFDKKLFYRTSKGMELTDEGKFLYNFVKLSIPYIIEGEKKLNEYDKNNNYIKTIRIASSETLANHFLFPKMNLIKNECKNCFFSIKKYQNNNERINLIRQGFVDLAIIKIKDKYNENGVKFLPFKQLHFVFFYNPKFFSFNEKIKIENLKNYPLILKSENTSTKKFIRKLGIDINPFIECEHDDHIIELTKSGLGIGFAPKEYLDDTLKILEVEDLKSLTLDLDIVYNENNLFIKNIIKLLKS